MKHFAPWTDDQVNSLNAYQESAYCHPFTCRHGILEATKDGWCCPYFNEECSQDWAHSWMVDWSWQKMNPVSAIPKFEDMTEVDLRDYLNDIAEKVKNLLPGKLFTLLVFDQSKIGQYVSNANRADMIKAMRELADVLEKNVDIER